MKKKSTEFGSREETRRNLLQLLAVGGVFTGGGMLPESWVKPVVDEIMLPAHAEMTPQDDDEGGEDTDVIFDVSAGSDFE